MCLSHKLRASLAILLLAAMPVFAQQTEPDVLPDLKDESRALLNDQLRKTNRRLILLEGADLSTFETATDDGVPIGNGSTFDTKVLPSCSDATTSKLLYTTATNTFSCGTDQDILPNPSSNVLFQYSAQVASQGNNTGEYSGTSIQPTGQTGNYRFIQKACDSYVSAWTDKFIKIPGVNTVTVKAQIWQLDNYSAKLKVDIGGAYGEVTGTLNQDSPEWVSLTIDVSGLTNSTVYDVTVYLGASTATVSYLGNLIAFGS